MQYTFAINANLSKVLPSFGEVIDSVNETMAGFGFDEKMMVRGQIGAVTVSSERELTTKELLTIGQHIQDTFEKKLPELELSVEWS